MGSVRQSEERWTEGDAQVRERSPRLEALRKSRAEAELICESLKAHGFSATYISRDQVIVLSFDEAHRLLLLLGDNFPCTS